MKVCDEYFKTTKYDSLDHHCWKKGIALPGGDIKHVSFTTVQACKEECAKTKGCVAFETLAGTENKCYIKNEAHAEEKSNPTSTSARMSCYKYKGETRI